MPPDLQFLISALNFPSGFLLDLPQDILFTIPLFYSNEYKNANIIPFSNWNAFFKLN